jgi:hypothetical protein
VFVRDGTNWTQQAYLKASNTEATDQFGWSLAVSGDTVVAGADYESSNATGVNGNQTNNNALYSGAAYVFMRSGTNWSQQAYLKASNTESNETFGWSVAVSGNTVVVGAVNENSNATGVNGGQTNNNAQSAGAAYVFTAPAIAPPELHLTAERNGDLLQLTAAGTPDSQWRLESRNALTGPDAWQPLTNITLGPSPVVVQRPLDGANRFYRAAWVP